MRKYCVSTLNGLFLAAFLTLPAHSQGMPPFGSEHDVGYAGQIWKAMEGQRLAGPHAMHSALYEGTDPHGMMLETFYTSATIDGHTGDLIVKRNYGPAGVAKEEVAMHPEKHLGAVTVMFRREAGFDAENQNWFWVKFLPDGSVDKNPKGMPLAGKVAKGMEVGCIACHANADGDDYVFTTDAVK
ncbi:MAG: cytochrome P460 family protein [Paracoccaceae bacterium]